MCVTFRLPQGLQLNSRSGSRPLSWWVEKVITQAIRRKAFKIRPQSHRPISLAYVVSDDGKGSCFFPVWVSQYVVSSQFHYAFYNVRSTSAVIVETLQRLRSHVQRDSSFNWVPHLSVVLVFSWVSLFETFLGLKSWGTRNSTALTLQLLFYTFPFTDFRGSICDVQEVSISVPQGPAVGFPPFLTYESSTRLHALQIQMLPLCRWRQSFDEHQQSSNHLQLRRPLIRYGAAFSGPDEMDLVQFWRTKRAFLFQ